MGNYFANWIILFPVGFTLFVATRLRSGFEGSGRQSSWLLCLRILSCFCFLLAFLSMGARYTLLSFVWSFLIGVLLIVLAFKNMRLNRSALLMTALQARSLSERQTVAGHFCDENTGIVKRKASRWRRQLALGTDWASGLETSGIAKSVYEKVSVRLQSRYGEFDRSAQNSMARDESLMLTPLRIAEEVERLFGRLAFFSWSIAIFPVLSLIFTFVVPTLKAMFEEFGLELPYVMSMTIRLVDSFVLFGGPILLLFPPLLILVFLFTALLIKIVPSVTFRAPICWFFRTYYETLGLVVLARVAEREEHWQAACGATAEIVPVPFVAARYERAAELLDQGAADADAFVRSGILTIPQAELFQTGLNTNEPIWGLRQLAAAAVQRMLRRYSMAAQIIMVAFTLVVAIPVAAIAIGMIEVLTKLILSLA